MKDSGAVALDDGFDHLAEEGFGHGFGQGSALSDKVKQILARLHAFHDDHKDVARVARVQQLHHARDVRHLAQQAEFQRYPNPIHLIQQKKKKLVNYFIH